MSILGSTLRAYLPVFLACKSPSCCFNHSHLPYVEGIGSGTPGETVQLGLCVKDSAPPKLLFVQEKHLLRFCLESWIHVKRRRWHRHIAHPSHSAFSHAYFASSARSNAIASFPVTIASRLRYNVCPLSRCRGGGSDLRSKSWWKN